MSPAEAVEIEVSASGFQPSRIAVAANQPTKLVFTRTSDETCATEVVMNIGGRVVKETLPLGKPVVIDVTFPKAGDVAFACAMNMVKGVVTVQ